jgi:hypothetical protein
MEFDTRNVPCNFTLQSLNVNGFLVDLNNSDVSAPEISPDGSITLIIVNFVTI